MKKCVIFSNCQGTIGISHYLKHSNFKDDYDIYSFQNYIYIKNNTIDENFLNLLKECDLFIYQPLSDIYPIYNTNNLLKQLKPSCKLISFPYIYNEALYPLTRKLKRDIIFNNIEYDLNNSDNYTLINDDIILKLKKDGLSLNTILNYYDNQLIDFMFKERFENSMNILKEKEYICDIKVHDYIIENIHKYNLFNTSNHPSNRVLHYCTNQILMQLGYNLIDYKEINEILPAFDRYLSSYEYNFYNYEYINKEYYKEGDNYYKRLITYIYNNFN